MKSPRPPGVPDPEYYRLERGLVGERLVPVDGHTAATHVGITAHLRLGETLDRHIRAGRTQSTAAQAQIAALQAQLAAAEARVTGAEARMAATAQEIAARDGQIRRLVAKNEEIRAEKRHLRDMLAEKVAVPRAPYRIEIDRDNTAEAMLLVPLDAMPGEEHAAAALAEARRLVSGYPYTCRLRRVLLEKTLWRAEILILLDG